MGERDWSLLGIAAAVVAVGLIVVFVLAAGIIDSFWLVVLAVVAGFDLHHYAAWGFSNLAARARLDRGQTPAEEDIDQRLEKSVSVRPSDARLSQKIAFHLETSNETRRPLRPQHRAPVGKGHITNGSIPHHHALDQ